MTLSIEGHPVYNALFRAGLLMLVATIAVGVFHSVRDEHRLPSIAAYSVGTAAVEPLIQAQDYDSAIRELELMLRMMPGAAAQTHYLLGRTYESSGELDSAVLHYREAITIEPRLVEAHNNLGVALARQGKMVQAVASVREALRLQPDSPEARRNLPLMESKLAMSSSGQMAELGGSSTPSKPAAGAAESTAEDEAAAEAPAADAADIPAEIARGRELVRLFYLARLIDLHATFTPGFQKQLPLEGLKKMREQVAVQFGTETEVVDERLGTLPDQSVLYVRICRFEHQTEPVELVIQLAPGDKVAGLMLRPTE